MLALLNLKRKKIKIAAITALALFFAQFAVFAVSGGEISASEDFYYTALSVGDGSGESYSYVFDGGILESVTVGTNGGSFSGKLLACVYDEDGRLESAACSSAEIAMNSDPVKILLNLELGDGIESKRLSFFMWNNRMSPAIVKFDRLKSKEWNITYEGENVTFDAPMQLFGKEIYVSAKNVLNLMGIEFEKQGDLCIARRDDGNSIEFSIGSLSAAANGMSFEMTKAPYLYDGVREMIPVSLLKQAFGAELAVSETDGTASLTYDYTEKKYPSAGDGGYITKYDKGIYYGGYTISGVPETSKVEVWYRDDVRRVAEPRSLYWQRSGKPLYNKDTQSFSGGFARLATSREYSVMYRVTDKNGSSQTFVDKAAFKTNGRTRPKYADVLNKTGGELALTATYENISYYIDYEKYNGAESCEITYRGKDGVWRKAYEPYNDKTAKQFRGSVVRLGSNQKYELKAIIRNSAGHILVQKGGTVFTLNNSPQTKEIKLSELGYVSGGLVLSGLKGSDEKWLRVVDDTGAGINGGSCIEALMINDCEYLILDGIKVSGGYRCGICVNGNSRNIRISNCDISGWGREGVFNPKTAAYICDGIEVNYDCGVMMMEAKNVTVEKCYIHDSRAKSNSWSGETWANIHPKGACGIFYIVDESCVIRYNDIIGDEEKRWNDAIEGWENGAYFGGPSRDTDIYGNMIIHCCDDGIELDGGQMNVRVYDNRIERTNCGISCVPNLIGPTYIFENVIWDNHTEYKKSGRSIKIGGSDTSMHYIFGNTFDKQAQPFGNISYGGVAAYHAITRNNIIVNNKGGSCYINNFAQSGVDDNDYDILYGVLHGYLSGGHSLEMTKPTYIGKDTGDLRLADGSAGKGAAVKIDNFNENTGADIGALQSTDSFKPRRPVNISASAYNIAIAAGESKTVRVSADTLSGGSAAYAMKKNHGDDWLAFGQESGRIGSGRECDIVLTATLSAKSGESAVVLFRLENGYSIPITVTVK